MHPAEELSNPDSQSKLLPMYNALKKAGIHEIVCDFCAHAFGGKGRAPDPTMPPPIRI